MPPAPPPTLATLPVLALRGLPQPPPAALSPKSAPRPVAGPSEYASASSPALQREPSAPPRRSPRPPRHSPYLPLSPLFPRAAQSLALLPQLAARPANPRSHGLPRAPTAAPARAP